MRQSLGDIAMNLGDQFYPLTPNDTFSKDKLGTADLLARLLAYGMLAETVTFPSRYMLSGGPLYEALHTAPQLLEKGLVRIALYEGVGSFENLARRYGYPPEALPRAAWLDEHVTNKRIYKPTDHGAVFQATLLADLESGGALRRFISTRRQQGKASAQFDRIHEFFASGPPDRRRFAEAAAIYLPRQTALFQRWAAMRYYTVPLLFDTQQSIRELPKSAAKLAEFAEAEYRTHSTRAPIGLDEAAPFDPIIRQLLVVPAIKQGTDVSAVNQIVDALLEVRERHEDARRSFLEVVAQTSRGSTDIREALRREMAHQQRVST